MKLKAEVKNTKDWPNPKLIMKGWAFLCLTFFMLLGTSVVWADIYSGLIGYWNFDDGAGTRSADCSVVSGSSLSSSSTIQVGNANCTGPNTANLNEYGGLPLPQGVSGKVGQAIYLGGLYNQPANQAISVSLNQALAAGSQYTIAFWAKNNNPQVSSYPSLIEENNDAFWLFFDPSTNKIGFGSSKYFSNNYSSSMNDTINWHHYAFVLDGSTINLYVDGIFQETKAFASPALSNFYIGGLLADGYKGALDDVRLYSRVLQNCEVLDLVNWANGNTTSSCGSLIPGALTEISHSNTSATLSWNAANGGHSPVTNQLQRSSHGTNSWTNVNGATSSSFTDNGLTTGATYDYQVLYTDSAAATAYSNIITITAQYGNTYYIDYSKGSDSNDGKTKLTPWQHAPGMNNCTGVCAATTPQPGDRFILKGGVTWPNASLGWVWNWMGTYSNPIYIGVDKTWWDPNGASQDSVSHQPSCSVSNWCRPILDGGLAPLPTASNQFLNFGTFDTTYQYAILDSIEFRGLYFTIKGYNVWGNDAYINKSNNVAVDMKNLYMHGWGYPIVGPNYLDTGFGIQTGVGDVGSVLESSTIDGWDTYAWDTNNIMNQPFSQSLTNPPYGTLFAVDATIYDVHDNVIRNVSNGMVGGFTLVYNNLIENIMVSMTEIPPTSKYLAGHANGLEEDSDCGALIYNNIFRHMYGDMVGLMVGPGVGCTDHVFNNLLYDKPGANNFDLGSPQVGFCSGGSVYAVNNTIEEGADSNVTGGQLECPPNASNPYYAYTNCTYDNNLLIGAPGVLPPPSVMTLYPNKCVFPTYPQCIINTIPTDVDTTSCTPGTSIPNISAAGNLTLAQDTAASQGIDMASQFSPSSISTALAGAGVNLISTFCNGTPQCFDANGNIKPMTDPSCTDANGNPRPSTSLLCSDFNGNPRPTSRNWDIGAYQFSSGGQSLILYGDVNGQLYNGQSFVSIADAELTAQVAVGLITLTPTQMQAAMVSSKTETTPTISDAYLIAEYSVGLITKFPVQNN